MAFEQYELNELLRIYGKLLPDKTLILGVSSGDIVSILIRESRVGSKIIVIEPNKDLTSGWFELSTRFGITTNVFNANPLDHKNTEHTKSVVENSNFIYIDCPSDYDTMSDIFDKYSSLVKPGGIIALYGTKDNKFWNDIKRELNHEQIVSKTGKGIGVLYINE